MRLLPKSMFLRLVLVLALVLLLAQLLSTALHFQDRGQVLYHSAGLNSAERIAGIVRLLDPMNSAQRERAVATLDVPALRISLDQTIWPKEKISSNPEYAILLKRLLHKYLGEKRAVHVMIREVPLLNSQTAYLVHLHPVKGPNQQRIIESDNQIPQKDLFVPSGVSFLARVKLQDDLWVTFDHKVPEGVFGWSRKLIWSLVVLLISTVLVAFIAVRWVTRPFAVLSHAADELGRDIHKRPLSENGPIEVRRAARAFNNMQSRIIRFLQDRSRMMAAISHDLKTPITRLRLRAEMLKDNEIKGKILHDLNEMETMVREALDFMRGVDSEEPAQAIDINALLESLQADAQATRKNVEIIGVAEQPYIGRPLALTRCISNLLNNASLYASNTIIHVRDTQDTLRISITDNGPGIPEKELEQVFEPFYRIERSRSRETGGTGLGLSIARNIARAHGGELVLQNRSEDGLEALLTLPR